MGHHWRINDSIAVVLLAITALAPLPLGSNRPMFWMLSAAIVFFIAAVFLLGIGLKGRALPIPLKRLWMPLVLGAFYLAFMALQSFGALPSATPNASLLATIRTLSYAVFFFLILQVSSNPKRASWMIKALFYSILLLAIIGFLARFGIVKFPEILINGGPQSSAKATFVNRNSFATYLGFGLLTGLALIFRRIGSLRPHMASVLAFSDTRLTVYFVATLVIFATLMATNSRMGVAAVVAALGFSLLILAARRTRFGLSVALFGVAAVAGTLFYLFGDILLDRLGSLEHDLDVRLALYGQVVDMILAQPWTGFGADSFEIAFQKFHSLPVSADLIWDKAHNSYLTNWAETGVVFGSVPILLLALAFRLFLQVVLRGRSPILPLLGLSVIVQGAIHSLADFSLEIQANVYVFLAIIAIGTADALRAIHDA